VESNQIARRHYYPIFPFVCPTSEKGCLVIVSSQEVGVSPLGLDLVLFLISNHSTSHGC